MIYTAVTDTPNTFISLPHGVTFGLDGVLYFTMPGSNLVRKVTPTGNYSDFGGRIFVGPTASFGYSSLPFRGPSQVYIAKDGREFVLNRLYKQIWVSKSGSIKTFAGGNNFTEDNVYPHQAILDQINSMAFDSMGRTFITNGNKIKVIGSMLPTLPTGNIRVNSEDGNEIFVFNSKGQHLETLSTLTGVVLRKFAYDAKGLLISIADIDNKKTTIERSGDGTATAIRGPFGHVATLNHNSEGYLSAVTQAGGQQFQLGYGNGGLLSQFIKPNGATSIFLYDGIGQLTRDEDHLGGFTQLVKIINPGVSVVRISTPLNADRVQTVTTGAYGETHVRNTGSDNLVQTVKKFEDFWVEQNPMEINRIRDENPEPRLGGMAKYLYTDTSVFNAMTLNRSYPELSPQDIFTFKRLDQLSYLGTYQETLFDSATKTFSEVDGRGVSSQHVIDAKERIVSSAQGNLTPIEFSYNAQGQLTQLKQGSRTSSYSYNSQGLLSSEVFSDGRSVNYAYDSASRITSKTTSDGRQIGYNYDQNGNLTSITPPGRRAHFFGINILDLMTSYLPPSLPGAPTSTVYEYDLLKRPTVVRRPDGSEIKYAYRPDGKLNTITTSEGLYQFNYQQFNGVLTSTISPDGIQIVNENESVFQPRYKQTGPISANYVLGYSFFPWGRENNYSAMSDYGYHQIISSVDRAGLTYNLSGSFHITRGNQNNLITAVNLVSTIVDYSHNNFGELLSASAHQVNEDPYYSMSLTRDSVGRVTQKSETLQQASKTLEYSYDSSGRLVDVLKNGVNQGHYEYDSNGNRTKSVVSGVTSAATYDDQDRLLTYGSKNYTYNLNGELVSVVDTSNNFVKSFGYNSFGNLRTAQVSGKNIQYLLDANNRRVGKKINGTLTQGFLYQSQTQIFAELDGANNLISTFAYGTKNHVPDYMNKGADVPKKYMIITDYIGSVRLVVDPDNGTIVQEMDYDEFGNVIKDTNPGFQPFGFAGGLYDRDTGLVRFGARDYDPETGRWNSKDPILFNGGDANLYGYVQNDPINWVDPTGLKVFYVNLGGLLSIAKAPGTSVGSVASSSLGFGFDTDSLSFFTFGTTGKGNQSSGAYGGVGFSGGYFSGNKCEFMGAGSDVGFSLGAGMFGGGAHISTSSGKTGFSIDFFGPGLGASGYRQSTNTFGL